ncbi:hypothetical protein PIB30_085059 [Stylosanthes scabra]|uniref:Uncharacterized protein n=1 Tax=Stylosanthes scabra TaxID=79078 RepID=A0ABU6UTW7_9FABA|nr:hypothetical protein [Stylosanthes scabra]
MDGAVTLLYLLGNGFVVGNCLAEIHGGAESIHCSVLNMNGCYSIGLYRVGVDPLSCDSYTNPFATWQYILALLFYSPNTQYLVQYHIAIYFLAGFFYCF